MSAEQFEELMHMVRYGFLTLAMIGYAFVVEPKGRDFGTIGKLFLIAMQTIALMLAPFALMQVLL